MVRSRAGSAKQLVTKHRPAAFEGHLGADLVEHLDPGREAGLDRVLGEQALGEGVQGADGRTVELVRAQPAARAGVALGIGLGRPLQLGAGCGRGARRPPSR